MGKISKEERPIFKSMSQDEQFLYERLSNLERMLYLQARLKGPKQTEAFWRQRQLESSIKVVGGFLIFLALVFVCVRDCMGC